VRATNALTWANSEHDEQEEEEELRMDLGLVDLDSARTVDGSGEPNETD
jgi:hypothetical protein